MKIIVNTKDAAKAGKKSGDWPMMKHHCWLNSELNRPCTERLKSACRYSVSEVVSLRFASFYLA